MYYSYCFHTQFPYSYNNDFKTIIAFYCFDNIYHKLISKYSYRILNYTAKLHSFRQDIVKHLEFIIIHKFYELFNVLLLV